MNSIQYWSLQWNGYKYSYLTLFYSTLLIRLLISCIWDNLRENRFKILEANADADTPIDKVAFQQGMNGSAFNVQFDGVDSLIILTNMYL